MSDLNKQIFNIVSSETTQIGRFDVVYDIIEKNGNNYPYSYVKMKNGVGILGFVEDSVILLKQYRYIWNAWLWEIPGGMIEDGESPECAAIRELKEETGFQVESIRFLGICYPSIGSTTEQQYLYAARCINEKQQNLDPLENAKISLVKTEEFRQMISRNVFCHGMGLAAWTRYQEMKGIC